MRIRSTKPEFWRSERIASVDWDARLVLKGLESYVDDNGVGKDDLALIVADVFPRDLSRNPTGTLQKVSEAISDLHEAGLLWRYEANGTSLLYVSFWESIQRIEKPTKGRNPRPDGTMDYRSSTITESLPESSGNPPGALRPGTGEQGNRGTGDNYPLLESQSSSNRARVSTDAIQINPMTKKLADQIGVTSLRAVVDAAQRHCGVSITADQAYQLGLWLLEKRDTPPDAPQRWVLSCFEQTPAEIQQHIYESMAVA